MLKFLGIDKLIEKIASAAAAFGRLADLTNEACDQIERHAPPPALSDGNGEARRLPRKGVARG